MADLHGRMATALTSIASATSVARTRADDAARAARDGDALQVEAVVVRLESVAADLWLALDGPTAQPLSRAA